MLLSQYAYFELSSFTTSAAEITAVLGIEPDEITALARQLDAADDQQGRSGALLGVVRRFNDDEGQDRLASAPPELIDGPDLLGWHLGRDVLDFLHATGAALDVDEYDYTAEPDDD